MIVADCAELEGWHASCALVVWLTLSHHSITASILPEAERPLNRRVELGCEPARQWEALLNISVRLPKDFTLSILFQPRHTIRSDWLVPRSLAGISFIS